MTEKQKQLIELFDLQKRNAENIIRVPRYRLRQRLFGGLCVLVWPFRIRGIGSVVTEVSGRITLGVELGT